VEGKTISRTSFFRESDFSEFGRFSSLSNRAKRCYTMRPIGRVFREPLESFNGVLHDVEIVFVVGFDLV